MASEVRKPSVCSRQKRDILGTKLQKFCLRKVARRRFFFLSKTDEWMQRWNCDEQLIQTFSLFSLNEFFISFAQQTNRNCEFKRTRFNTNYLTFTWGTPFKHKEEEATTTTTTTTVLWLSLVLLLHELEEWLSGLPLPLPLLPLLLRWVVLNNNNNFKIKNKRWCYER